MDRVAEALAFYSSTPLYMAPSHAQAFVARLAAGHQGKAPAARHGEELAGVTVIIPIHGPLVAHEDALAGWYGLTSYEWIRSTIDTVAALGAAGVVLDIDSPGGQAANLWDLCDYIRTKSAAIPIAARASGLACSAAYAIGAACPTFCAGDGATVGSIGVIMTHTDWSALNERIGIKVTHITSGTAKADGSPDAPLTDDARARLQTEIDALADVFFNRVATWRGMTADRIKALDARIYVGQAARAEGLVDDVATLDEVLEIITATRKDITMPDKTTPAVADELEAVKAAYPQAAAALAAAGVAQERARMTAIDAAAVEGLETLTAQARAEGWDVARLNAAQIAAIKDERAARRDARREDLTTDEAPVSTARTLAPPSASTPAPAKLTKESSEAEVKAFYEQNAAALADFDNLAEFANLVKLEGFAL